jgi:hypothetical protein
MKDDRTDLEVFQQCRDQIFGDRTSAAWLAGIIDPLDDDLLLSELDG